MIFQAPTEARVAEIVDSVFAQPAYQWSTSESILGKILGVWNDLWRWFQGLEHTHPTGYYAIVGALTIALVVLLGHLAYLTFKALTDAGPAAAPNPIAAPPIREARWYLGQARDLAEQRRFREAVAQAFLALMLTWDERSLLTFHPSKTPAEYLQEVQVDSEIREAFGELVRQLYAYLFAGQPCAAEQWQQFDGITRQLIRTRAH